MDKIEMVMNEVVDIKRMQKLQVEQNVISQLLQIKAMVKSGGLDVEEAVRISRHTWLLLRESKVVISQMTKDIYQDIMTSYKTGRECVDNMMNTAINQDLI